MQAIRTIYRYWAALLFLAVLAQIGAAGYGAFYAADKSDPGPLTKKGFDHGFSFHNGFGYFVFLGGVVLFLLALAARLGRRRVLWALAVPLSLILQIVFAWIGESTPAAGFLHPLNALVVAGLTGSLAVRVWMAHRFASAGSAPTPTG